MILRIISPTYNKEVSIAWLELNTDVGNFVIQPGHEPVVLILEKQKEMKYCLTTGKQESIMIARGIVDIHRTHATVIISN